MATSAFLMASRTLGFGDGCISWPYGLMYQIRWMREGRSSEVDLEKRMFGVRRVGRVPGMLASSSSVSASWMGLREEGGSRAVGVAVGALG